MATIITSANDGQNHGQTITSGMDANKVTKPTPGADSKGSGKGSGKG